MNQETVKRVSALPCFVRRGVGLLDAGHKLLLLQLALLSEDGRTVHLVHESARGLRQQTSFSTLRFASALRRLEHGRFIEIAGDVTTDKFTIYIEAKFQ